MSQRAVDFLDVIRKDFEVDEDLTGLARECWDRSAAEREACARRAAVNQVRVTRALTRSGLDESGLAGSWGYGYGDRGRQSLEEAWRETFGAEAALVRPQIATGTQALALCLGALLRPGEMVLAWPGRPYDTLQTVLRDLAEGGIGWEAVETDPDSPLDQWLVALAEAVGSSPAGARTRVVLIQRSRGYSWRRALTVGEIGRAVQAVRSASRRALVVVDNCYGEFVEEREPPSVGADLTVGSLLKNPGGGLCSTGGYVAGRAELVRRVSERLYAPGQGGDVGPTGHWLRLAAQGFFLAPHAVGQALAAAVFAAHFFGELGFPVSPGPREARGDIVQAISLGTRQRLRAFCRGLQKAGPVDAHVRPEPWPLPGYTDPVIMAGGVFVPGASLELGADGPWRPPFAAYFQGGLVSEHGVLGCLLAAAQLKKEGLLPRAETRGGGEEV